MFNSCLGTILMVFVVMPMIIVLLWKTGILAEMRPAISLVINAVQEILRLFIEFLRSPNTGINYNLYAG